MDPFIIVGGGISGLLAARALKKRGISFIGLERSDILGGRALVGHHRLYEESSVDYLSELFTQSDFNFVEDAPQERKKGVWKEIAEEMEEDEKFYLGSAFYKAKFRYSALIERLAEEVGESFKLRKEVNEIKHETHEIVCQDGSTLRYSKLLWCCPIEALNKVFKGDRLPLFKLLKKNEDVRGGIQLNLEMAAPMFDFKNTVVFPFRFKDKRLHALGSCEEISDDDKGLHYLTHWLLFLDNDVEEDREEVAKCLRSLRRELEKEFPEMRAAIRSERIVYLPYISGEIPAHTKTLEVLPNVIYIGPQVGIGEVQKSSRNLDRVMINCRQFETMLDAGEPA